MNTDHACCRKASLREGVKRLKALHYTAEYTAGFH
jgi:hypothetical protein